MGEDKAELTPQEMLVILLKTSFERCMRCSDRIQGSDDYRNEVTKFLDLLSGYHSFGLHQSDHRVPVLYEDVR